MIRLKQVGYPTGVDGARATKGEHCHSSEVDPTLYPVHPGGRSHVLVHHLVDASCRLQDRHAEAITDALQSLGRKRGVKRHVAS